MTRSKHLAPALLVSVLLGGPALSPAHAARYVFTLTENPCGMDPNCTPSVTGTGSGNINTDGLTFLANDYVDNVIVPTTASIIVGPGPRGRANIFGGPISPLPISGQVSR